jgi:hypothetical protein
MPGSIELRQKKISFYIKTREGSPGSLPAFW